MNRRVLTRCFPVNGAQCYIMFYWRLSVLNEPETKWTVVTRGRILDDWGWVGGGATGDGGSLR